MTGSAPVWSMRVAAAAEPTIRAVLLRAAGERSFCVGADLKEERSPSRLAPSALECDYTAALSALSKPVVVAIHGFCLGAGLEIALVCDVRIASPEASFALPEVNLGLIPGAGGTQRLARLIGAGRALDMMMTGERISADQALAWGIVTRLASSRPALDEMALMIAKTLASKPPLAVAYLKEVVAEGQDMSLPEGLAREKTLFSLLSKTEDRAEAVDAFRAKRPPRFVGR